MAWGQSPFIASTHKLNFSRQNWWVIQLLTTIMPQQCYSSETLPNKNVQCAKLESLYWTELGPLFLLYTLKVVQWVIDGLKTWVCQDSCPDWTQRTSVPRSHTPCCIHKALVIDFDSTRIRSYTNRLLSSFIYESFPANSDDLVVCILQEAPARQLTNLKDISILMEAGEASHHGMYDYCTLEFLRQAGSTKVEHVKLADMGIHGNRLCGSSRRIAIR